MTIKNAKFLCACARHSIDVHDGSKNECCDQAIILPMLSEADMLTLVPEGQQQFKTDLLQLANLVEGGAVVLEDAVVDAWYKTQAFPLIEADYSNQVQENTPEVAEEGQELKAQEGNTEGFSPEEYYMEGFESGFAAGFSKGFDTGHKLSVTKK